MMKNDLMKITLALMLAAGSHTVYGQCDKTLVLESSNTNYLDGKGKITRTKDEQTTVTISKTAVVIQYGENGQTMSGEITGSTCNWKTPFKDGKMVVKASLENPNGMKQEGTLTIVGVEGEITLTYEARERPGVQIQIIADKFEEKKV